MNLQLKVNVQRYSHVVGDQCGHNPINLVWNYYQSKHSGRLVTLTHEPKTITEQTPTLQVDKTA